MTEAGSNESHSKHNEVLQEPWLHERWLKGGHAYHRAERYEEAIAVYNRVIELDPDNALAYIHKGRALASIPEYLSNHDVVGTDYVYADRSGPYHFQREEAVSVYRQALLVSLRAIHRDPTNARAYLHKGDALYFLDSEEAALKAYDHAVRLAPDDPDAYVNKGWLLFTYDHHEEALEVYEKVLHLDPKDADIHYRKGVALWEMRRYEDALQSYERAALLAPCEAAYYYSRGMVLRYLGRNEEADQVLAYAQRLDESSARDVS